MTAFIESKIKWLCLPQREPFLNTTVSLQYGAGKVAGKYCRLHYIPTTISGHWQHGWVAEHMAVDPRVVPTEIVLNPGSEQCWVGRKDEEQYLLENGYLARAIGLPIAYLPDRPYKRKSGSLLVMPGHSLTYTKHKWRFAEYAEDIDSIKSEFSSVTICVHPACAQNGYWISEFKKLGFPIILGADVGDRLSLVRIKALLSQFEFVTTNSYGSHIAYACAFGAKLSIYGPYCEYKIEDCAEDYFYIMNPGLAEKVLPLASEACIREQWPEFFGHPAEAISRTEWGLREIGYSNRISPKEIKEAFEWSNWRHYKQRTRGIVASIARRVVPQTVTHQMKRALSR